MNFSASFQSIVAVRMVKFFERSRYLISRESHCFDGVLFNGNFVEVIPTSDCYFTPYQLAEKFAACLAPAVLSVKAG
uniref:Aminodeoxychorismate synthase n=1 Tax=Ascaris lumbricoides TaxID=6252 RepID=A0A0M3HUT9_ASCLU